MRLVISIMKTRQSHDRLIFIKRILISRKMVPIFKQTQAVNTAQHGPLRLVKCHPSTEPRPNSKKSSK